MKSKDELTVFVSDHCFNCKESLQVAEEIKQKYPDIIVNVFNVDHAPPNLDIFAVPTYALNGRVVFLGNPTDDQIANVLDRKVGSASGCD